MRSIQRGTRHAFWQQAKPPAVVRAAVLAWLLLGSYFMGSFSQAATIQDVAAAWRQRASKFKSGWIEWRCRYFSAATLMPGSLGSGSTMSKELNDEGPCVFAFSGDKLRYEYESLQWIEQVGDHRLQKCVSTTDGKKYMDLSEKDPSGQKEFAGRGVVSPRVLLETAQSRILIPVLAVFRPFETPTVGDPRLNPRKYVLTPQRGRVGDTDCLVIEQTWDRFRWQCWVAPQRGFLPMRYLFFTQDDLRGQIDLEYAEHPEFGWIPRHWKITNFVSALAPEAEGQIDASFDCEVTKADFNTPIDPKQFEIVFPAETIVSDGFAKDYYVVRASGERRTILQEELNAGLSDQTLIQTETGEALPRVASRGAWWWFLAGVVLIATTAAVFASRRRRARNRSIGE